MGGAFVPLAGQFSRRLRERREAEGWSTRDLEEKTGIPKSVLNRYELEPGPNPSLAHLVELRRVFGLRSIEELFGEISYPTGQ